MLLNHPLSCQLIRFYAFCLFVLCTKAGSRFLSKTYVINQLKHSWFKLLFCRIIKTVVTRICVRFEYIHQFRDVNIRWRTLADSQRLNFNNTVRYDEMDQNVAYQMQNKRKLIRIGGVPIFCYIFSCLWFSPTLEWMHNICFPPSSNLIRDQKWIELNVYWI